jgi:hypothetical protein
VLALSLVVILAAPAHAAIVTMDFASFSNGAAVVNFDYNEGNGNILRFRCVNTWCQKHPQVNFIQQTYPKGVRLSQAAMGELEKRLERLTGLEKYFVSIRPMPMTQTGL